MITFSFCGGKNSRPAAPPADPPIAAKSQSRRSLTRLASTCARNLSQPKKKKAAMFMSTRYKTVSCERNDKERNQDIKFTSHLLPYHFSLPDNGTSDQCRPGAGAVAGCGWGWRRSGKRCPGFARRF